MGYLLEKLREKCKIALRDEQVPSLEAVLEESRRRGVFYGSPLSLIEKWRLFVQYVAHVHGVDVHGFVELLGRTREVINNLVDMCNGDVFERFKIVRGKNFKICHKEFCIEAHKPDGVHPIFYVKLSDLSTSIYFPSKLPREDLEMYQIGWRASDETTLGKKAAIGTSQAWQVFSWLYTRPGEATVYIRRVNITSHGLSLNVYVKSSWREQWTKEEALLEVLRAYMAGDLRPLFTWWLGDGIVDWNMRVVQFAIGIVKFRGIVAEIAKALGGRVKFGRNRIIVSRGRELAKRLLVAGRPLVFAEFSHKWHYLVKLSEDRKAGARRIISPVYVDVNGVEMVLQLNKRTVCATKHFKDLGEAMRIAATIPGATVYRHRIGGRIHYVVNVPLRTLIALGKREAIIEFLKGRNSPDAQRILSRLM